NSDSGSRGGLSMAESSPSFVDPEFLKKLERLRLIAKRLTWTGAKGEHSSSRKGFSLEFSDYRRYQHGDDLRYVDWNIYRRLDRRGCRAALEELARKKHQLLVIHILDEQEITPRAAGDVSLLDVEGGRERRFFLDADLLRRFQQELQSYFQEIESVCSSRQAD